MSQKQAMDYARISLAADGKAASDNSKDNCILWAATIRLDDWSWTALTLWKQAIKFKWPERIKQV